jgi:hypothetical protein
MKSSCLKVPCIRFAHCQRQQSLKVDIAVILDPHIIDAKQVLFLAIVLQHAAMQMLLNANPAQHVPDIAIGPLDEFH